MISGVTIFLQVLAGFGLTYGLLCLAVWLAMRCPPDRFLRIVSRIPTGPLFAALPVEMLWKNARAGNLRPGDPAPDFQLPSLDQTCEVSLSSLRGKKPVFLVFGSYT